MYGEQRSSFHSLEYYGTNHGNWYLSSDAYYSFYGAVIYADHDFKDNSKSYEIIVDSGEETAKSIAWLTLYVSQPNVDITLIGKTTNAFRH